MITNKIIHIVLTIIAWAVLPLQIVTTFILGILVSLTFGILAVIFDIIWRVLFLYPLIGISYIWEAIPFARVLISTLGIPFSVVGDIYVSLIPSMGEMENRIVKMLYCQTFPYTWKFHEFHNGKMHIDSGDNLIIVFRRISIDKAIRQYLNEFLKQAQSIGRYDP